MKTIQSHSFANRIRFNTALAAPYTLFRRDHAGGIPRTKVNWVDGNPKWCHTRAEMMVKDEKGERRETVPPERE